jgi:hypothetical protein
VTTPRLNNTNVKSVKARALHNDQQLAILAEWSDSTQNDSMVRVQDFRDAVAVQFPLTESQPFICMGIAGTNVNIWHWKADWQADIAARKDMETAYPNMNVDYYPFATTCPRPDYADPTTCRLFSGNPCASTRAGENHRRRIWHADEFTADNQPVQLWQYATSLARHLGATSKRLSRNAQFEPESYPMAFAADGANNERNGRSRCRSGCR